MAIHFRADIQDKIVLIFELTCTVEATSVKANHTLTAVASNVVNTGSIRVTVINSFTALINICRE